MKKGTGFFGFLFGTLAGGLFALFTAKRKGSEVRKDFMDAMKNKENLMDLLVNELKGLGEEAKKAASEMQSSEAVEEYKDMAKEKFDKLYGQAQLKMNTIKKTFEDQWEDLRERFEEEKENAKDGIMKQEKILEKKIIKGAQSAKKAIKKNVNSVKAKLPKGKK